MSNIYTRTGDRGKTSLFDGARVDKDSIRVEAYGTVDELGSHIGFCKNYFKDQEAYDELFKIQNKLFIVASNLATQDQEKLAHRISQEDIDYLEALVDKYMGQLENGQGFIVPGTNMAAGSLHIARTVCRRAERRILALAENEAVDQLLIKYVNRLSDTIYALARFSEDEEINVNYE